MSHFNIDRPRTLSGESARALLAKMWNSDLEHGPDRPDAYRLESTDVESLCHHLGQVDAERAMRRAGFVPLVTGAWITRYRTVNGGDNVQRLFPPYDLLQAVARFYGRDDHGLTVSTKGTVCCDFGNMTVESA